jgi:proteasome lid subunit RPN8/RPN11
MPAGAGAGMPGDWELQLEVRREGSVVGRATPSTATCREDGLFRRVVSGRQPNDGTTPAFRFEPLFETEGGPDVASLALVEGGEPPAERYEAREVFAPQARALVRQLLAAERLGRGDEVDWAVVARPGRRAVPARFGVRTSRAPYPLRDAPLPGVPAGETVFAIDAAVLRALRGIWAASGAVERAGLLLGHVVRDAPRAAAAPLEAGRRCASRVQFAFDAASFAEARRAAEARSDAAVSVGWYHSHPPCAECPRRRDCRTDTLFFSDDDVEVHASAFPSPYMAGLVVGKLAGQPAARPGFRLYAWERARVGERPFAVLADRAARDLPAPLAQED